MGRVLRIWWRLLGPVSGVVATRSVRRCARSLGRGLDMRRSCSIARMVMVRCGWIFGRRIGGSCWMQVWVRIGFRWWVSVRLVLAMLVGRCDIFLIVGRRVWPGG